MGEDPKIEFLQKVPFFAGLKPDDLAELVPHVQQVDVQAGEILFHEGDPGDRAYIIQDGQIEILKVSEGRDVLLAVRQQGEIIGEMSLLEENPRMASARARSDSKLLILSQETFNHLLDTSPKAVQAMLHTNASRLRATEAMLDQSQKMAQLGTLTAGIAHELNNPAAAVQRAALQLLDTLPQLQAAERALSLDALGSQGHQELERQLESARQHSTKTSELGPLERSDREFELESWFEQQGIDEPWSLTPAYAEMGFGRQDLDALGEKFESRSLVDVVRLIALTFDAQSLLAEVEQGASRISDIVSALKTYTYLDRAPLLEVDVHQGLENTLLILRGKLKERITVHKEFDPNLPKIEGYGSELNQVWTNLIDNAVDAIKGLGDITLRTRGKGDWVVVEIEDTGEGIPEAHQSRIFDSFFTTKEPGKGTGLGLHTSYNIVVHRHRGDMRVTSQPGRTVFQVWLPQRINAAAGGPPLQGIDRADDQLKRRLLTETRTIAVVGITNRASLPSHSVPAYLQKQGYQILPIHPRAETILGEPVARSLKEVDAAVDLVLIFCRADEVLPVVQAAIDIGAGAVWMQEGIVNQDAAAIARAAGLEVVMDSCMRTEFRRLIGHSTGSYQKQE